MLPHTPPPSAPAPGSGKSGSRPGAPALKKPRLPEGKIERLARPSSAVKDLVLVYGLEASAAVELVAQLAHTSSLDPKATPMDTLAAMVEPGSIEKVTRGVRAAAGGGGRERVSEGAARPRDARYERRTNAGWGDMSCRPCLPCV